MITLSEQALSHNLSIQQVQDLTIQIETYKNRLGTVEQSEFELSELTRTLTQENKSLKG